MDLRPLRAFQSKALLALSGVLVFGAVSFAEAEDAPTGALPRLGAAAAEQPFLTENDTAMNKMMAGMNIKPTRDTDRDFVAMMVPHHQGAIDMAEAELRYGHNEQLLRISQEIVVEQLQEIAAMRVAAGETVSRYEAMLAASNSGAAIPTTGFAPKQVATNTSSAEPEAPFLAENDSAMNKMMAGMAIKPTGDIDRDFVAMMVPHHQGAIDMAEAELRYGRNAQLRRISQEIIVDQMQEITGMRLAVGEQLPPSVASPTDPPPASPTKPQRPQPSPGVTMRMSPNQMSMKKQEKNR